MIGRLQVMKLIFPSHILLLWLISGLALASANENLCYWISVSGANIFN